MKSIQQIIDSYNTSSLPYAFMFSKEQEDICEDIDRWEGNKPNKTFINGQQYTECFHVFCDRLDSYKKSFPDGRLVFVGNFDTFAN